LKHQRDLSACIAKLEAVLARNEVGPEQGKYVNYAINELRELRRKPQTKPHKIHEVVRDAVEALAKAFLER
jgi:signal recognition particle GTPase